MPGPLAGFLEILRIVLGSVYVLVMPGLAWSFLFFPKTRALDSGKDAPGIDWIERGALSFGLSIALVPLTVFLLTYFLDVPLTTGNAVLIVLVLTLAPLGYLYLDRTGRLPWRKRGSDEATSA